MKKISVLALAAVLLAACTAQNAEIAPSLKITAPAGSDSVSADGGTLELSVAWSAARWKASADNSTMITDITPVYAGNEEGEGVAKVTLAISANSGSSPRSATVTVTDTGGAVSDAVTIVQNGRQGGDDPDPEPGPVVTDGVRITVDPSETHQVIDGWGGMNNWGNDTYLSNSEIDALFSPSNGLGLNILRIRIMTEENKWKNLVNACKYAINTYGALILASPWTPPASMKDNGSLNGSSNQSDQSTYSHLKPECYEDYALYLEKFAKYMKDNGAPLYAISVQNEPDWPATYEGCNWTGEQNRDFIRDYGHLIQSALLTSGESLQMKPSFYKPLLADEAACANFDIVAGHIYGGGIAKVDMAAERGKHVWMTEHLLNDSWTNNSSHWTETMSMLTEIHKCLKADWNAYIWWYAKRYYSFIGDGEQETTVGEILQRGHAFGQYSRYVRPGYVRIGASASASDLLVTAFEGDGSTVVVIVNTGSSAFEDAALGLPSGTSSATATYTGANASQKTLDVSVEGSSATFIIPSKSVTTVVMQ